jgi:hypothetical protein
MLGGDRYKVGGKERRNDAATTPLPAAMVTAERGWPG